MKLPEKEWLTLVEVAEKWRTDVEYLKHCLITGKLKPCLRQGRDLLQIENYHDMQWEWSWKAEASYCDLAKCKIQLTCKDVENARCSGDREVCEDDILIALSEVQRFEKAYTPDPVPLFNSDFLEARRSRKQKIDVLPSLSGVRSASSVTSSDLGGAKQDSELDGSAGIPRQATGHNIEPSSTIKLPLVDDKEVIPVRLIPLITEPKIEVLQLVECLWNPRGEFTKRLNHCPSCADWEPVYEELQAVTNGGIGKQIEQLPSGMYVSRSDFEAHECTTLKSICLKLDRAVPSPLRTLAYEGFPEDAAVIPQPGIQMPPKKDPVLELRHRLVNECRPSPPYIPFDTTHTVRKYRVPEGKELVRLAGGAGHIIFVDDTPRHIMAGFEQEAIEKGCIAVEQVEAEQLTVPPTPAAEEVGEQGNKKSKSKTGKTKKPRKDRSEFWSSVEQWVRNRRMSGQPGIDDFRQAVRANPGNFAVDGRLDEHPSPDSDGKRFYYCLASGAEVPEGTVKNRIGEFYRAITK